MIVSIRENRENRIVGDDHHEEVKGLVEQSLAKQEVTEVKVDRLDKKVDKVTYDLHQGQTRYLKDLSLINKTLKNNAASYDKTYALMDTTDVAAVNSFNAKWLSKADSLDEW
jgi:4-hydroxy-3-methylbut-2-enyl diphosphate reductase IspH